MEERPSKKHLIYFATLAEQAERYDDMCDYMSRAALLESELEPEDRNLLAIAFKQSVAQRRSSWRIVCGAEMVEQERGNDDTAACARGYRKVIERELIDRCRKINDILQEHLIRNTKSAEAKVQYYKSMGDYYRYIAEISDDKERTQNTSWAKNAYEDGTKIAERDLPVTSQHRLGLAMNHAVFYYEIMKQGYEAINIARKAYDDAQRETENPSEEDDNKPKIEPGLIMHLLRDNIALWEKQCKAQER